MILHDDDDDDDDDNDDAPPFDVSLLTGGGDFCSVKWVAVLSLMILQIELFDNDKTLSTFTECLSQRKYNQ